MSGEWTDRRLALMAKCRRIGMTYDAMGFLFDVSITRVRQLLARAKRRGMTTTKGAGINA